MTTPTIQRFAREALDGLDLDDVRDGSPHRDDYIRTAADGEVTSMTTDLFQLVVDDNALAFLDYEGDGEPDPFNCLRAAILDAVEVELRELIEQRLNDEAHDADDQLDDIADGLAEGNAPDPVQASRYLADAGLDS